VTLGHYVMKDLIGETVYDREGGDLATRGLYLDVPPWNASVFSLATIG
jgi:hypothetical protein